MVVAHILSALIVLLLAGEPALGQTFLYSSTVNPQSYTGAPRPFVNVVLFSGVYRDFHAGAMVELPGQGVFPSNVPLSLTGGDEIGVDAATVFLHGDPWRLSGQSSNWTTSATTGQPAFANTTGGAGRWFVLHGPAGSLALRADIAVLGDLYAPAPVGADRGRAAFTLETTAIASPTAALRERVAVANGAVVAPPETCVFTVIGTIPDQCFDADGSVHAVSYVVRSNPFVVESGVPFFLATAVSTAAAADPPSSGNPTSAYSTFETRLATSARFAGIPELTAEGFVVDLDGDPATHDVANVGDAGYVLRTATPPTLDTSTPAEGGVGGPVTATVTGSGIAAEVGVKLVRAGQPDVVGTIVSTDPRGQQVQALFDLENADPVLGPWDVVVVNDPGAPASSSATLPGALSLAVRTTPEIVLSLVGPSAASFGGRYRFGIAMANPGNTDAFADVTLDGVPAGSGWTIERLAGWRSQIDVITSKSGTTLGLPTTIVPAGQQVIVHGSFEVPDDFGPSSIQLHLVREE